MKNKTGHMNIPFSEVYNEEDDVYYVTFKTGEPSYCMEVDDIFVMELGLFSNLPTGFRVLNFSKQKIKAVQIGVLFKKIKNTLHEMDMPTLKDRETRLREALEDVLV